MAEILLVNPRRRRRKHARARRRNPQKRRAIGYTVGSRKIRRRKMNPSFRHHRRRRRNPSFRGALGSLKSGAMPTLKAGAIGATGALGLDLLWGYGAQYLPASIAGSPIAQYAVKLLGALAVGMIGGKILKGKGTALAVGATTVVLHDALKAQIKSSFPSIPLGEYLTFAPTMGTMPRAGRLLSTGVGEYLSGLPDQNNDTMEYSSEYSADGMSGM